MTVTKAIEIAKNSGYNKARNLTDSRVRIKKCMAHGYCCGKANANIFDQLLQL